MQILKIGMRSMLGVGLCVAAMGSVLASDADAQTKVEGQYLVGERYVPTIWIDPDGCEHWVMDDGAEGYMSPHLNRDGTPVCRSGNLCGVMNTDQFFGLDSYAIGPSGRARLKQFFMDATASSFVVIGHTDSSASDAYNLRLSQKRANAVAQLANQAGRHVTDVRGYGERNPKASNATAAGMAQNRRVEIICIR